MKAFALLPLALAASGSVLGADPLPHGANAVISAITCKAVDLTPNDGVAAYARLIPTRTTYGPFYVFGALLGNGGQKLEKVRAGAGLESLYLTLDSQGSSGTAFLAPSGNGTVGLLSASSATAPGRVFDAYTFEAAYHPQFRLGPNSAVKCQAQYVVTAWARQAAGAPDTAFSYAYAATYEQTTGEGGAMYRVQAAGNPVNGERYAQKSGQLSLVIHNYGGRERIVTAAFQASIDGGRP